MGVVRYTVIDGEVIAEKRNGVRKLYVPDPLGSTVALIDNTQTITDTFTYWPYGEVNARTGTTPTPLQFVGAAGYYRDSTIRTYVRARTLNTAEGRWMTKRLAVNGPTYSFGNNRQALQAVVPASYDPPRIPRTPRPGRPPEPALPYPYIPLVKCPRNQVLPIPPPPARGTAPGPAPVRRLCNLIPADLQPIPPAIDRCRCLCLQLSQILWNFLVGQVYQPCRAAGGTDAACYDKLLDAYELSKHPRIDECYDACRQTPPV